MASSSHAKTILVLQICAGLLGLLIFGLGAFVFEPYINATPEAEKPPLNVPAIDYSPWRSWAVQADGRTKPFETASREMLRSITGRSKFEKQDSVSIVLMWMMTNGLPYGNTFPDWESYPFILADHHDLRKWIYADKIRKAGEPKLSESDITDELLAKLDDVLSEEELHGKYVAPKDLRDSTGFKLLLKQAAEIRREDPEKAMHQMSPEQTKAQEVNNRLGIYDKISQTPIVGSQDWNEMWLNDPMGVVQLDQVLGSEWFPIGRLKLTMGDIERHWRITLGNRMMQHPKKYIDATKQSELARFQGMIRTNKALDAVDEAVALRQKENHGRPVDQAEVDQLRKQVKQAQNESYSPEDPKYLMLHLNYMELRYPAIYFDALSRQPFPEAATRSVLNAFAKMQGAYLAQAGVKQGSPELAVVVGPIGLPGVLTFPSFDEAAKEFFATLKRVSDETTAEGVSAMPNPALQPAIIAYNKAITDAKDENGRSAAREALHTAARAVGEDPHQYPGVSTIDLEIMFHKTTPFMWAWVLMVPAVAAFLFSVITGFRSFYIAGFAFYAMSLAFQVFGFYCRIAISGRPPVSNMYETIIFVAFMSCVFAMILELIYPKRVIAMAGSLVALIALVLADQLPLMFDQELKPLQPVLRSNFWLVIHVLTIVASYAGGTLAWGLANVTLFMLLFGKPDRDTLKTLSQFTYRAMQIAVLLLATGTFLGGWWAAYSWGRFWGWDPKETWALISLLCYVIPLHARFIGWVKDFGLAVSAVVCYAAILMCWYGVNFVLGAGLHSYGFGGGGPYWVLLAGLANLEWVLIASMLYLRKLDRAAARNSEGTINVSEPAQV